MIRKFWTEFREGWWLLCNRHANTIRGEWALYEFDWEREFGDTPLPKGAQQRRDLALAWAGFLEDIGGERRDDSTAR